MAAGLLGLAIAVLGVTVPVPLVALGPGPTYDTLGGVEGVPVVAIDGLPTYPTAGHLNMTTVAVADRLTTASMLGNWASGSRQVVPRAQVFPPGRTDTEVRQDNAEQFAVSEANAEIAALAELALPTRVVVASLVDGAPAAGTLEVGDELVSVMGRPVTSPQSVADTLRGTTPGQSVPITYQRGTEQREATVQLGASPDRPQGLLGVLPTVEPRGGDIRISLGDVGGPSAGLMFALAVVDKLTPGDLTGGRFVAGTGTIAQDGVVGPIGGIPFKMHAAREAGATEFLVPAANCAEAATHAPDGLVLIRVNTLGDAVAGLDAIRTNRPATLC